MDYLILLDFLVYIYNIVSGLASKVLHTKYILPSTGLSILSTFHTNFTSRYTADTLITFILTFIQLHIDFRHNSFKYHKTSVSAHELTCAS